VRSAETSRQQRVRVYRVFCLICYVPSVAVVELDSREGPIVESARF
jgi:hypothetical protein